MIETERLETDENEGALSSTQETRHLELRHIVLHLLLMFYYMNKNKYTKNGKQKTI